MDSDYSHLNIENSRFNTSIYSPEEHICLFGETILDTEDNSGIFIVGDSGLGKTRMAEQIAQIDNRFKSVFSDKAPYNYNTHCFVDYKNNLSFPLEKCIFLIKEDENISFKHEGIEQTVNFLFQHLDLKPEIFQTSHSLGINTYQLHNHLLGRDPDLFY